MLLANIVENVFPTFCILDSHATAISPPTYEYY